MRRHYHQDPSGSMLILLVVGIVVLGLVIGPFVFVLTTSSARLAHPTSTTVSSTHTVATTTTSGPNTTTATSTDPTTAFATTTAATTTFPTTAATTVATTLATTTTVPTTTVTTTVTTTTTPAATLFPTCTACSYAAQTGTCAAQYTACLGNPYNCPVLCYGTFQLGGTPSLTCNNGLIPQWPPMQSCICNAGGCSSLCADCGSTTPPATTSITTPPVTTECMSCFSSATSSGGACESLYAACTAVPSSNCALLCAPYYQNNLVVYSGCNDNTTVAEWPPLRDCLCPLCGLNCTANACP